MNGEKNKQYVFKSECPQNWDDLTKTSDEKIRYCGQCDKNVHLVQNENEFNANAEKGNCIFALQIRTAGIVEPPEGFVSDQPVVNVKKTSPVKKLFLFAAAFLLALPLVSFLPLFVQRTMIRSQTSGGDVIDYSWKISTFYGFLADYDFFRPEENFIFFFGVNLALAFLYSFIIVFIAALFWIFRTK